MESNGFIITLWIVWIIAVVAQLVVAVKIFGMASDTKAIKEMMQQFMRMKQAEAGIPAEDFPLPKEEPKKVQMADVDVHCYCSNIVAAVFIKLTYIIYI